MRMVGGLPVVVGLGAAALALVLTGPTEAPPAPTGDPAVPERLADYSWFTGSVSASPPGAAVALFQHGYGVEFLDFPQAVVLGVGGDTYRRVDVAEERAGGETQGDPAPMLLSPDGTRVAVGDHDLGDPSVVVVDLTTGETSTHPLPQGRSVIPVAWSPDGRTLASLLSTEPTNPYSSERITGDVGLLDVEDDTAEVLADSDAYAVAFSPDGADMAIERTGAGAGQISILDLASGARRDLEADGVLAGPTAWSPDGRLLAITSVEPSGAPPEVDDPGIPVGLSFVDATGAGGAVPEPRALPLSGPGRILAWAGPDEIITLLQVEGSDTCCGADEATLSVVPLDGSEQRTLMRMDDLTSYGVGRFQMAASAGDRLQVVAPSDVDRGPWPLPWRIALSLLVGAVAWLVARVALRMVLRGMLTDPRR